MRKVLLVVLVFVGVVSGNVMSQGVPADDARRTIRVANPYEARERQTRTEIADILQQARDKLRRHIAATNTPAARDLDLMRALDSYLLENQFDAVIKQLEEIMKSASGTEGAKKAEAAIHVLKGDEQAPTSNPLDGTKFVPQRRRPAQLNEPARDVEDRRPPVLPTPSDDPQDTQ